MCIANDCGQRSRDNEFVLRVCRDDVEKRDDTGIERIRREVCVRICTFSHFGEVIVHQLQALPASGMRNQGIPSSDTHMFPHLFAFDYYLLR